MVQTKLEQRRFNVGAVVMARWPKSNLYFEGTILDYNDVEYLVRFTDEDKSELAVKFKDVQLPFTRSRSRSRSRGRTPSKSPSRRKSPSRGSSSKKSNSRSSPGRGRTLLDKSPEGSNKSSNDSRSISKERKYDKSQITTKETQTNTKSTTISTSTRQSSRIAQIQKMQSEGVKKMSNAEEESKSNSITVDTKSVVKSVEERNQFLTKLGRLFRCLYESGKSISMALFAVAFPFIINSLCSTTKCEIKLPNLTRSLAWYWDTKSIYLASAYIASVFILSFFPIGKCVKTKSGSKIRCNGYVSVIALCVAVGVLKSQNKLDSIPIRNQQLFVAFSMFGAIFSLALYLKSFYARRSDLNPTGKTGYYVVDFIQGRELTPRIASFDLKFFLLRLSFFVVILLNIFIVIKGLEKDLNRYSPTLLVTSGLQIFYVLDIILFEETLITTYEYTTQGLGFFSCVGYLSMPFMFVVYSRYILSYRIELPWYCLLGVVVMYLIGYTFLRGSNSQKHAFRTNPADPALVHMESLPTSTGSRLLVSGWWGLVRHPNYLGDIIVQLSWTIACGFTSGIPWIATACSLLYLLARIFIVEKQCKAKYGLAWSSYTARVPYRIIPKVF